MLRLLATYVYLVNPAWQPPGCVMLVYMLLAYNPHTYAEAQAPPP
jgi:hypothetical protein